MMELEGKNTQRTIVTKFHKFNKTWILGDMEGIKRNK